ncbi:MAG: ribonuclease HII [Brucellaceae bacterium]|nr:ribonuclease HII [Brucellaceae bacterium]
MARRTSDSPLLFDLPLAPDFTHEARLLESGLRFIAGMDEAGRGPLAGPVVAAAVILDANAVPDGLDDSKRLSEARREALFDIIMERAVAVSVCSRSAESIDRTDIRAASLEAMARAVRGLSVAADHALADGRDVPPGLPCPGTALVKGDQRSVSIAAASIVAKVTRDRMLRCCESANPAYGFGGHKGYGSAAHRDAIAAHGGMARIHRYSFSPLKS